MDWIWWAVTILVVVVVGGVIWFVGSRNHLETRAEHSDPKRARELRDIQDQIDKGHRGF